MASFEDAQIDYASQNDFENADSPSEGGSPRSSDHSLVSSRNNTHQDVVRTEDGIRDWSREFINRVDDSSFRAQWALESPRPSSASSYASMTQSQPVEQASYGTSSNVFDCLGSQFYPDQLPSPSLDEGRTSSSDLLINHTKLQKAVTKIPRVILGNTRRYKTRLSLDCTPMQKWKVVGRSWPDQGTNLSRVRPESQVTFPSDLPTVDYPPFNYTENNEERLIDIDTDPADVGHTTLDELEFRATRASRDRNVRGRVLDVGSSRVSRSVRRRLRFHASQSKSPMHSGSNSPVSS